MLPFPKPSRCDRIYDVVNQAGIDTRPWHVKEGGTPVKTPTANPHYCYRWAFIEEGKVALLCMWYEKMTQDATSVCYTGNAREEAIELERAFEEHRHDQKLRDKAKRCASSARQFDDILKKAYRNSLPVRCAIVARKDSEASLSLLDRWDASYRELDSEVWSVDSYEMQTGHYVVRRIPPAANREMALNGHTQKANQENLFADQFVGTNRPTQYIRDGKVFERLPEVRAHVLKRAAGRCELPECNALGFLKENGELYLETHHVRPLCEGGADTPDNVIALCPNHHREAHFGAKKAELFQLFVTAISATEKLARQGAAMSR